MSGERLQTVGVQTRATGQSMLGVLQCHRPPTGLEEMGGQGRDSTLMQSVPFEFSVGVSVSEVFSVSEVISSFIEDITRTILE